MKRSHSFTNGESNNMSLFTRSAKIVALAGLLALAVGNVSAQVVAEDRATCDRAYKPQVGQEGKDVVWVPTPDEVVQRMLQVAKVTPRDGDVSNGAISEPCRRAR